LSELHAPITATLDFEREEGHDPVPHREAVQSGPDDSTREVAGIFDSYESLCAAASELYRTGFHHWDVMREARQVGTRAGRPAADLVNDPGALRTDRINVELVHDTAGYMIGTFAVIPGIAAAWAAAASGATAAATLMMVVSFGGGGAAVGAIMPAAMARSNRRSLIVKAASDGLALWVQARTAELEAAAIQVLQAHNARGVQGRPAHDD